jgi:hypothetical protein
MGPGHVRPFALDDAAQVAGLYAAVFPGNAGVAPGELERYLADVFLRNPWHDPCLPSLVYETGDGSIIGFLGVIPRPMVWHGRPVRAAVTSSFIVAPWARHSLAGIELLRTLFAGPQDLSLTDAANDSSRTIWERLGGSTALLYSLRWTRLLRPYRYAAQLAREKRSPLGFLSLPFEPAGRSADTILARLRPNRFPQLVRGLVDEPLDAELLVTWHAQLSGAEALQPLYTPQAMRWLLRMAEAKRQYGPLRRRLVRDRRGAVLGWWLYYLQRGGVSRVLQFGATDHSVHQVLAHLFHDAWRCGSAAISGRLQPRFIQALSLNYCSLKPATWTLVHSKTPDLLHDICRGHALLTWLEGESWTRFLELVPDVGRLPTTRRVSSPASLDRLVSVRNTP